jgi:uncharacterized membrane protein
MAAPGWDPLIVVHAVAASYALGLGGVQVLRRKGDRPHRWIGRSWLVAMAVTVLSSFGVRTLTGGFSWLHGLSAFTAVTLTLGVLAIRRGDVRAHGRSMIGTYLGLLGAFVGVLVVPTRRIPELAVTEPLVLAVWAVCLVVTTAAFVVGVLALARPGARPSRAGPAPGTPPSPHAPARTAAPAARD